MTSPVNSSTPANLPQLYQTVANDAQNGATKAQATQDVHAAEQAYEEQNPGSTVQQFETAMDSALGGASTPSATAANSLVNNVATEVLPAGADPTSAQLSSVDHGHKHGHHHKGGAGGDSSSSSSAPSTAEQVWDPQTSSWVQQPTTSPST